MQFIGKERPKDANGLTKWDARRGNNIAANGLRERAVEGCGHALSEEEDALPSRCSIRRRAHDVPQSSRFIPLSMRVESVNVSSDSSACEGY